jgi:hypothetical protein
MTDHLFLCRGTNVICIGKQQVTVVDIVNLGLVIYTRDLWYSIPIQILMCIKQTLFSTFGHIDNMVGKVKGQSTSQMLLYLICCPALGEYHLCRGEGIFVFALGVD